MYIIDVTFVINVVEAIINILHYLNKSVYTLISIG